MKIPRATFYKKVNLCTKRSYVNVGRNIPGFSLSFDGQVINDVEIQKYIVNIKKDKTSKYYGYRKVTYVLRRKYNLKINKKKVRRLMCTLNLLGDNRKNKTKRISRTCESRNVTGSNQLWQMDIKYAFIAGTKQTAYITSIIDVYDRETIKSVYSEYDFLPEEERDELVIVDLKENHNMNLQFYNNYSGRFM